MSEPSKLDLLPERSEEVRDILGRQPTWMIRWGTVLVFGILAVLGFLSWAVTYPEVIPAPIVLTSENPPIDVYARTSGRISQLFVADSQEVEAGTPLALLENAARWEDIGRLHRILDTLRGSTNWQEPGLAQGAMPLALSLGELQPFYTRLTEAWMAFQVYGELNPISREQYALTQNIAQQEAVLREYQAQLPDLEASAALAEKESRRYDTLRLTGAVSATQQETKARELLQARSQVGTLKARISEVALQILERKRDLLQLNLRRPEAERSLQENLLRSRDLLQAQLEDWEQKYLLKAPISGRVSFFRFWSTDQYVPAESPVMTVVPERSLPIVGKVRMPVENSGRVKVGQRVNILLDNYPFQEFGVMEGRVDRISQVPREASYAVDVSLPKGLTTQYEVDIPFRQELQGTAEIITEDLRLIQRLLYQLRKALRQRKEP